MPSFKSIKESFKSLWKWFPIIWRDRQWDSHFIFVVLLHKISLTRKYIEKERRHTTWKRDVKNLKIAEALLKRLTEGSYDSFYLKEHEEKWGAYVFAQNGKDESNILFDNEFSERGLVRSKVNSQKDWEKERNELRQILQKEESLRSQDMDYLFKHLRKHIKNWWD